MKRLMDFVVGPVFLILLFVSVLILLALVVSETKRSEPATVHLKPGIQGGDRDGEVTKTDKYVMVKSDSHGEETFTWDQILYISQKDPSGSRKLDRVIDMIDLLSKLGIAVTVVFFVVGLYQYSRSQKWEREKFLASIIKEFSEWKPNRNAMHMIDSLALYKTGRIIQLFPDEEKAEDKKVFVTNEQICAALTPTPLDDLDESDVRAVAIRDCFDSFLSYMDTFYHYVEQDLITQDALSAQVGYWFSLFGPKRDLSPAHKTRIFAYATKYGLTGFEKLVRKYSRPPLWERIVLFFIR